MVFGFWRIRQLVDPFFFYFIWPSNIEQAILSYMQNICAGNHNHGYGHWVIN
jgi:hypothetical protein